MNRPACRGSLLLVAAVIAACAAQRDDQGSASTAQTSQDSAAQRREQDKPGSTPPAPPSTKAEEIVTIDTASVPPPAVAAPAMEARFALGVVGNACCVAPIYQQPANTERYQHLNDNPVHLAAEEPVSTFSIDVDTGAYANVRRYLNGGQLPPQDAVRGEEMINYFDYQYSAPASRDTPFSVSTELAHAPWNAQVLLMKVGIKGYEISAEQRPAANLVFLIDVSGSMQTPDKLPLLKNAFRLLTDQLTSRDRVAIVVYAGSSGVVLEPTPGDQKYKIREAIDRLEAGGSTNGAEGIERAYQLAHAAAVKGGINRVVLATDGDFNVGIVDFESLVDMAERQRESGVALTTLGFGTGNYNDQLLERLADAGNGNYAYVDTLSEARKVLVSELSSTLFTIAKDVKIQIEFNPAEVLEYRLIGYENRMLAREDFNNDKVDAGEIGAGHRVTALYEIVPVGAQGRVDPLRYAPARTSAARTAELCHLRLRYKRPDQAASQLLEYPVMKSSIVATERVSADFRFAAGVAAFGQLLRGGKYLGNFGYADIEALARGGVEHDPDGYRHEFLSLVKLAGALAPAPEKVGQIAP